MREGFLHRDGTLDSVYSAGELGQNTIARRIGYPPTVLGDEPIHDLAVTCQDIERPDLVSFDKARVACHVRREDSDEPPLDLLALPIHWGLGACPGWIVLLA
jgi:hypothetical protein